MMSEYRLPEPPLSGYVKDKLGHHWWRATEVNPDADPNYWISERSGVRYTWGDLLMWYGPVTARTEHVYTVVVDDCEEFEDLLDCSACIVDAKKEETPSSAAPVHNKVVDRRGRTWYRVERESDKWQYVDGSGNVITNDWLNLYAYQGPLTFVDEP
ncbi:MAG: hypothetical protein ACWGQW_02270 [bacterium]